VWPDDFHTERFYSLCILRLLLDQANPISLHPSSDSGPIANNVERLKHVAAKPKRHARFDICRKLSARYLNLFTHLHTQSSNSTLS
jgi:hypothetical protein